MAAALVALVIGAVVTFSSITDTDAVVDATASEVGVEVEAGAERMVFVPEGQGFLPCGFRDADGNELRLGPTDADVTVTIGTDVWRGVGTFTSPTSEVTVACDGSPGDVVRIGEPFGFDVLRGVLLLVLLPLVLGLVGTVILIVTTVLWFSRKPAAAHPGRAGPPAPSSPPPPGW